MFGASNDKRKSRLTHKLSSPPAYGPVYVLGMGNWPCKTDLIPNRRHEMGSSLVMWELCGTARSVSGTLRRQDAGKQWNPGIEKEF